MLEAGIVQPKNSANILFKNLIDASLAAVWCVRRRFRVEEGRVTHARFCECIYTCDEPASCRFWLLGYGLAYGTDSGGFIGTSNFATDQIYNGAGEGGSDGWEGGTHANARMRAC